MLILTTRLSRSPLKYSGEELTPHWIYRQFDILGNALVAFTGPAEVALDHMVDLEDVKHKAPIYSPRMLHFLGEFFIDSLDQGILLQHLFLCQIYEALWERGAGELHRRGNDIYFQERKLSVSIATRSPVSVLLHAGLNIETYGTPIPTSGLQEMDIEPFEFGQQCLSRFESDVAVWNRSRVKVLPR